MSATGEKILAMLVARMSRGIGTPLSDRDIQTRLGGDLTLPAIRKIADSTRGIYSTGTPRARAYFVRKSTSGPKPESP